jgi:tetratricopeptide (TPR) repeat protein
MIWTPIPLELTPEQVTSLKDHNTRLLNYLEKGFPLKGSVLEALEQEMTEIVNQTEALVEVLKKIDNSGDHFVVQLEHPDNEILNLPWTMASDNRSQRKLGSIGQLYLTKVIPQLYDPDPSTIQHLIFPAPLKVLIMISSPEDTPYEKRLSYEEEEFLILKAFEPLMSSGDVEIDFTDDGSLQTLERKLKRNRYHVVHFSGHSIYKDGTSYLLLESPMTLKEELVTAAKFAASINCVPDYKPPLVLLSACQSAQGGTEQGIRGATNQLLKIGVPAVISMGLSIADKYATAFAASFYAQIAEKQNVSGAFKASIEAIRQQEHDDLVKANASHTPPLQWIIPNLYLRTRLETPVDWNVSKEHLNLSSYRYIVEKNRLLLQHDENFIFIGRRRDKAGILPALFKKVPILLKGQGGVGKTAMAEYLVQRLIAANPQTVPLVFNEATTSIQDLLEAMKRFLSEHRLFEALLAVDKFDKGIDKFNYLCSKIEQGGYLPIFVFDNLESFQSAPGEAFSPAYEDIALVIEQLCRQQNYRVILTCRYPLEQFPNLHTCDLNQVALTDFWKRCHYLNLYRLQEFFRSETSKLGKSKWLQKPEVTFLDVVTWLHNTFGGNYRALEWFDRLFDENPESMDDILKQMDDLKAVIKEKSESVIEQMRKDLKFNLLLELLEPEALTLLMLLTNFNIPVQQLALALQPAQSQISDQQSQLLEKLHRLTLIEHSFDPETYLQYYYATPLVKDLFSSAENRLGNMVFDHHQAGIYHYHMFENVEFSLTELEAAFDHFEQAAVTDKVSQIGDRLSAIYYSLSLFRNSFFYAEQVYEQCGEESPSSVLNRLGMIYYLMGNYSSALKFFDNLRKTYQEIGDKSGEGTTLNNISQIYDARGDYETALKYLEASLKITQEIGDKSGEAYTMFNLAMSYLQHFKQPEKAQEYLTEVVKINVYLKDAQLTKALQNLGIVPK